MPRKRLKMASARDIKRTMARVSNMILNGELEPKAANAIIYACNTTLSSIRIDEQEARLDELEQIINEVKRK